MTNSEDTAVFNENFAQRLALGDRWHYVEVPGYVSDDGEVSNSTTGMSVAPPARNPDTGEPMFTKGASGFAGHLKWIVLSADTFAAGDGPVRVTFRAAAECFGTAAHPYGDAVVLTSCQDGTCGTCETAVLAGVPDHRDSVLNERERTENDCMMICVSRSQSAQLVLEL